MAEISMNKVIHGAFRRDLARFEAALGSFPPGDLTRSAALGRAWDNFEHQLHHHHTTEHEIAWPTFEANGFTRELTSQFDAEHEAMAVSLAKASTAMRSLVPTAGQAEATGAADAVRELATTTDVHLRHEEDAVEQWMLDSAGTPVLKEMSKKFQKSMSPPQAGIFFTWLLDGASPQEATALKATVPAPVIAVLTTLFGRKYKKSIAPTWS